MAKCEISPSGVCDRDSDEIHKCGRCSRFIGMVDGLLDSGYRISVRSDVEANLVDWNGFPVMKIKRGKFSKDIPENSPFESV